MFVEHKQLKVLNLPATRVARLNSSGCNVQMAFPGYPPQMCAAYLVSVNSGNKVLVVVGFYLSESRKSVFFVPQKGEVPVEDAERTFEEGFVFAESMGFVLSETDYHLRSAAEQQKLWSSLPICQISQPTQKETPQGGDRMAKGVDPLEEHRQRSLKSLGRFLASM
ncbi:hypothetical protein SAMN02745165_00713 [Malonomonas rubra DSM 5091]|uniref:Uncharacterized protein n=1 Tax=Malonomonas rubra DSM 5091 TaxID=1122189 RepID=A0A1M6DJQ3_MALRU|nr:hypothetical protein [Malonomonas rubra]SHI73577.1 hypothetical protein SAMN02745165_00713 [Malonomonas rubra DSM 5091]